MATISTHNGSSVSRQHNLRNRKITDKETHINPNGEFEVWVDEKPQLAYERIFGDAVREYNAKQKDKRRKIDSYYHKIQKDKKKHVVYEMIVGIYPSKEEKEWGMIGNNEKRDILFKFVETWEKRNPNLELIGAYYHADEEGEPHCHIDYIPVAKGYNRGMSVQNGLVKALGQQGFKKQKRRIINGSSENAQIQWERRENKVLEELCEDVSICIEHPKKENIKHIETDTYKLEKNIEDLKQELDSLRAEKKDFIVDLMNREEKVKNKEKAVYDEVYACLSRVFPRGKIVNSREELLENLLKIYKVPFITIENAVKQRGIGELKKLHQKANKDRNGPSMSR